MVGIILTCCYIFFGRILDVAIGTLRIIFVGKGKSGYSFLLGFLEVFIWFMVAKDVLSGNNGWWTVFPYSFGFATGTYIGSLISERFVSGTLGVQVITSDTNKQMIDELRKNGYALSAIEVEGMDSTNHKYMLFMEINKKNFNHLKELIHSIDEQAFIVMNETKFVQNGYIK